MSRYLIGAALAVALGALPVSAQTRPPRAPHEDDDWRAMLQAIMAGDMGPSDGWFKPSQSRYDWAWMKQFAKKGMIVTKDIDLPPAWFDRLDRDGDGTLSAGDLDWSAANPLNQKTSMAGMVLRRGDRDSDGKLSADEWAKLFEMAAKGEKSLDIESLRKLLFPAMPPRPKGAPPDMPSTTTLLQGLYSGEIGSPFPGPRLGDFAPDFTLPAHDGSKSISLRSYRGKKPVALIFGSFT